MKVEFLQEPELEFGVDRHVDVRSGIMNYGPVDFASPLAPKEIRLGIVGTSEAVEGVAKWFERCREQIPEKQSKQPNLFPKFPGFQLDSGFQSTLVINDRLQRTIKPQLFKDLSRHQDFNQIVTSAVELIYTELSYLATNTKVDVLVCAVPQVLLDLTQSSNDPVEGGSNEDARHKKHKFDFHHLLKARAMDLRIPVQLILPSTYDETKRRRLKRNNALFQKPQDEATRAWNLHTALYYKAKGVPWRLTRHSSEYATCYVGVSFYQTLDRSTLLTSVAQVFNERGEGVIVRGGPAKISKDDRQVHLDKKGARRLLESSLLRYKEEHRNFPARVVIHKTSTYTTAEMEGFLEVTNSHNIEMVDLIHVDHTFTRLFRKGSYPPLRGTLLSLDSKTHLLYTRGSVDFFQT
jgi:hypothetical protein